MGLDNALHHPANLAERRFADSTAFLESRDTNFAKMLHVVAQEVEGLQRMLLTSSAVHGLANTTSDIDTICIIDGKDLTARTATQFFDGGNHFETIFFTTSEADRELERLRQAASGSAAQTYAAYQAWDKNGPMKRKYLERLVNGVTADGLSPYLAHLDALGPLWRAASLGQAIMAASCMTLAMTAGRQQAAFGYGINAVLFAMDALMSHHGQVYSNKKWYRLRFSRFLAKVDLSDSLSPLANRLVNHWNGLLRGLQGGDIPAENLAEIFATVAKLDDVMDTKMQHEAVWEVQQSATTKRFLPGAFGNVSAKKEIQFLSAPLEQISIGTEQDLSPDAALNALRAIRGGAMSIAFAAGKA